MRIILLHLAAGLTFATAAFTSPAIAVPPADPPLALRDRDTVVWLGATFFERMQQFGHVETIIYATSPARRLQFRNLGWSGDEVTGISRAVFGSVEDGFQRLKKDLGIAKPTLVIVQYGAVEAERGAAGEAEFARQLSRLLDEINSTKARVVLLTPFYRTRPRPFLPDPAAYNRSLDRYCEILREAADSREIPFIDVRKLSEGVDSMNGLVPTAKGYQQLAAPLAAKLGFPAPRWTVVLDIAKSQHRAEGATLSDVDASDRRVSFLAKDTFVAPLAGNRRSLTVNGLSPGNYLLKIANREIDEYSAAQLSDGVLLPATAGAQPGEQLRQKVIEKNELFFHRHRPQNETYLFLFRKHEQGNNAVEVPQFDPLIAGVEARIEELRIPRTQNYELTPLR